MVNRAEMPSRARFHDLRLQHERGAGPGFGRRSAIATGMMPDDSKYYVANFLDSTISVIDTPTGVVTKTIALLANYDPISGAINGPVGALPIQTPVSPDGKVMVTPTSSVTRSPSWTPTRTRWSLHCRAMPGATVCSGERGKAAATMLSSAASFPTPSRWSIRTPPALAT
jgi:YVTN family beta-propeller protein